jgi:4-amino-4-deoxy-L-arabinose transferase-like glycosyltransferase
MRFYRLDENLIFHGELGHNYLAIKNFVESWIVPLLGPPTSHPWLSFGPLFYWIFAPILILFNYQPIAGAYFFAFVGVITIWLNYRFVEKLYTKNTAILSSLMVAVSPAWINFSRESRFYTLVIPLIYIFLWYLIRSFKGNKSDYFKWGICLAAIFNFHLSPIIFVPVLIILFIVKKLDIKKIQYSIFGFVIPFIPVVIHEILNGFEMTLNFIKWIPYRIAGFMGLIPQNNIDSGVLGNNFTSLVDFVGKQILPAGSIVPLMLLSGLILYMIFSKKSEVTKILVLFAVIGYIGIFIHGNPPAHYYLPLYPIVIILLALMFEWILGKYQSILLIAAVFLLNLSFFFSDKWFYIPGDRMIKNVVPYVLQENIAKEIVSDAQGKKYSLFRQGPYDYFDENYSQNYRYLLWLNGNEPERNTQIKYTIIEREGSGLSLIKEVE